MTSEDLRIDAQLLTGIQIDPVTAFIWVKDAISWIARNHPLSAPKITETFTAEDGDGFTLSNELVRLEGVKHKGRNTPLGVYQYECDERGNIRFYSKGEYEVVYRYVPKLPQTKDENIELPDRHAETIKYHLASLIRGRIYGSSDGESRAFEDLFWKYLSDADLSFARANKRYRRMPTRF